MTNSIQDDTALWTAFGELSDRITKLEAHFLDLPPDYIRRTGVRVKQLEQDMKTVTLSLKGLLELGQGQQKSIKEMLSCMHGLADANQKTLEIQGQLAHRVEENENAANNGQSPVRWRAQQATINGASEAPL